MRLKMEKADLNFKPLFRIPFTRYFICIEKVENRIYLCVAKRTFKINNNYMWNKF